MSLRTRIQDEHFVQMDQGQGTHCCSCGWRGVANNGLAPHPCPIAAGKMGEVDDMVLDADVGRNSPCPCGSGKKLKKCHG